MTQIYIIRHAEAEGNIFRRIHGHYNSRITANGYRQIAALKERFSDIRIDAVYASDLFRTCETAKAIYEPKQLPLHKDARFREVQLGVWEDKPFGWLEHFEPQQMYNFNHDPYNWYAPEAESAEEYSSRFVDGMTELAELHNGQTIAIFTHGCVSGEALKRLFGEAAVKAGRCDNTGVSLLQYENGIYSYSFMNDNSHLSESISTLAHQLWWRGKRDFNLWYRPVTDTDTSLFNSDYLPYDGHQCLVAMLADRPVGYLSYAVQGKTLTVSCLYLIPECRHVRMGDQLLGAAIIDGRAQGCTGLTVGVPTVNTEALAFFARMGAQVVQMDDAFTVYTMPVALPAY